MVDHMAMVSLYSVLGVYDRNAAVPAQRPRRWLRK